MPPLGIVNIPNHYVSDWSQGHGREWAEVVPYDPSNTQLYNPHPPVGTLVNGEWVARYSQVSIYGKISTQPRFVLSTKHGFTLEVPVTLNAGLQLPPTGSGNQRSYYYSVVLYNGEASYFGVYFRLHRWGPEATGGLANLHTGDVYVHNCGYGAFEVNPSGSPYLDVKPLGWWDVGDKLYAKIVCDPSGNNGNGETRIYIRNETKNPSGEYEHIWTRYHEHFQYGTAEDIDPRVPHLQGPSNFKWLEPASLWITGAFLNWAQPGWNIDLHPITIDHSGSEVVLAGAGSHYPWSSYDNILPSGFNSWNIHTTNAYNGCILFGELEARPEPSGMVAYYSETWEGSSGYVEIYGSNTYNSPVISAGKGEFSKLRLYGRGYTSDALQVRLLDTSTMQPIAVAGQTVFRPSGGHLVPLEVDISTVQSDFILSTYVENEYQMFDWSLTGYGYENVSSVLFGFVVTGTPPPPPEASPKGGRFQTGQTVTIKNIDGMTVIYTLDGSDPRSYILMNPEGRAIFNPDGDVITTGG